MFEINKLNLKDRVHLIGRVSNVYDYMQNSDIFVLSSLWEELGFVIVESAFKNLFIISSNCPNGPKDFIEDNNCGILFESNKKTLLTLGTIIQVYADQKTMRSTKLSENFIKKIKRFENI